MKSLADTINRLLRTAAEIEAERQDIDAATRDTARALRAGEIGREQANARSLATQARRHQEQKRRRILANGLELTLAKLAESDTKVGMR